MSNCATRSNAVRRVREMRAGAVWYRGGSFLAAECIYATALRLYEAQSRPRRVLRGVFALLLHALQQRTCASTWTNKLRSMRRCMHGFLICGVCKFGQSRISQTQLGFSRASSFLISTANSRSKHRPPTTLSASAAVRVQSPKHEGELPAIAA